MRNGAGRDVLKVWMYAVAVVVLAAWTSPLLYNAGKAIGEVTAGKPTNGFLKWLGARCQEAEFPSFFVAALVAIALLLFLPFSEWLDLKRRGRGDGAGQALKRNPRGVVECATGLLLAGGALLLTGYGLMAVGSYALPGIPSDWRWLLEIVPWIVLGVILQEWLLRGVALGIFLRGMLPGAAILLTAVLGAAVFFLKPPAGFNVPDPDADGIGFELVKMIGLRLADPRTLMMEVLPVLAMGCVLGYARLRTASLWLPVGIHMGWLLANALFMKVAKPIPQRDEVAALLSGPNLLSGMIPLGGILIAGALVYFLTNSEEDAADDVR